MSKLLLLYSTTDGHTLKICHFLKERLESRGIPVALVSIAAAGEIDPAAFDTIVIGASIRYGRHDARVADFMKKQRALLEGKPNAFFSVNLVARKPHRNQPDTNPYMRKFLRRLGFRPALMAVFAGKLSYPDYGPVDRGIIRMIMALTGGPTDPRAVVEFTDWAQVEAFAESLAKLDRSAVA